MDLMKNLGTPETPFYVADLRIAEMTIGPLPEAGADRAAIIEALGTFHKCAYNRTIFNMIGKYLENSIAERIVRDYHAGAIRPELAALLEKDLPKLERTENPAADWRGITAKMIREGKADFSPFKGPQDTGENWLLKYHIAPLIIPYFEHNIKDIEAGLKERKAEAKKALRSYLSFAIDIGPIFEEPGKPKDKRKPLTEEVIQLYANALKRLVAARSGTEAEYHFLNWPPVDFYLNPITGGITDLRPFRSDVKNLVAPISWDFLKDYAADALAIIAARKRKREKKNTPPPSVFDKAFIKMFNANPVNSLININTTKPGRPGGKGYFMQNLLTNEWEYKSGGTEITVPVKKEPAREVLPMFSTSTWKLAHLACMLLTAKNQKKAPAERLEPKIETSVREYMAATGRKITTNGVKDITKTLKKDLKALNELNLKDTDKKYSLERVRPFPEVSLQRGKITIGFSPSFVEYLAKKAGFLMNYPAALLKLTETNSNLYPLGYKLALNRSNDTNIKRGRANVLSVLSCLASCPGIPSIEDVRRQRNSPAKRIIEPFEKTMDELQKQGVLDHWEYCLPKGEPLKEAAVTDYNYFISLLVLYEIKDFPISNELERIQAAEEKRKKRKERIERLTDANIAKGRANKILEQENKKQ